ncbi:store-operated calcium entry regulator STIMATE isoform X2 [Cephus cinctus]|uniref:Store-operated calcium entry regulator STIMATE isoform X2 n=1 Tax=Cephus cinctus TaxID=211228 RepID=A0AAJ7VZ99_CEPCN|nr:store-operated calcium entry regulator STIMATE isoform X2 [Cephus cinctus]
MIKEICVTVKRFCEPRYERRPWLIWFYDTSKQGLGALVIHLANVYLASRFQGDPCTWYIINFLLDSSVGLLIIWIGIRFSQCLARTKQWEAINFGEYGKPPSVNAWLAQCILYVMLMIIVKICITLLIQLDFWDRVKDWILAPITNPQVELAIVMLVIPFFVNALMFWVTDNFLMRKSRHISAVKDPSLLQRVKIRYRRIRKDKRDESESDVLLSADEDLLDADDHSQHLTVAT